MTVGTLITVDYTLEYMLSVPCWLVCQLWPVRKFLHINKVIDWLLDWLIDWCTVWKCQTLMYSVIFFHFNSLMSLMSADLMLVSMIVCITWELPMSKHVRNGWMDWKQLRLVHVKFHPREISYKYVVVLICFWFEIF